MVKVDVNNCKYIASKYFTSRTAGVTKRNFNSLSYSYRDKIKALKDSEKINKDGLESHKGSEEINEIEEVINELYKERSFLDLKKELLNVINREKGGDLQTYQTLIDKTYNIIEGKLNKIEGVNKKGFVNDMDYAVIDLYFDELCKNITIEEGGLDITKKCLSNGD